MKNDDWAPGDLALCVDDDWLNNVLPDGPRRGSINEVIEVDPVPCSCGCGSIFLVFAPWCAAWGSSSFTKIKPLTDEEVREALEDLKIGEPVT